MRALESIPVAAPSPQLIARQPIFDRAQRVIGYELLHRSAPGVEWHPDDDVVTREVIAKALLSFGLDRLAGRRDIYLNLGAGCLLDGDYLTFPAERTVLELLERTTVDDAVVSGVLAAQAAGYRVALDDYTGHADFDVLLPIVDIVKIDVLALSGAEVAALVKRVRVVAPQALLLAEKVESEAHLNELADLSFDLFQGYYFKKPSTFQTAGRPNEDQAGLLRVAAALQNPDLSFDRLAALISSVPSLTYKLLKLARTAAFGLPRQIRAIREVIPMLGLDRVRRIVNILVLTTMSRGPEEVGVLALVRARLCSTLSRLDGGDEEAAFTTGLFSLMDVALRMPLATILDELHLSEDINLALLDGAGPLAEYLALARAFEDASLQPTAEEADALARVEPHYLEAVAWAEQLRQEFSSLTNTS